MHNKTTRVTLITGLVSLLSAGQAWAAVAVPEPSILLLFAAGIGAVVGIKVFSKRNK